MPRFREVRRGEAKLGLQPKRTFGSPSLSPTLSSTLGSLGRAQPWKCGGKWSGRGLIGGFCFFLIFNNLIYADDTTLIAEGEEPLIRMKKESEKAGLRLNIQKTKIIASSPITLFQIDGKTMETVTDYFLGLKNYCRC